MSFKKILHKISTYFSVKVTSKTIEAETQLFILALNHKMDLIEWKNINITLLAF